MSKPRSDIDVTTRVLTVHLIVSSIALMVFGYGQIATRNFDVQTARNVAFGINCGLSIFLVSFSTVAALLLRVQARTREMWSLAVVLVLWAVVVIVNVVFLVLYYTVEQ